MTDSVGLITAMQLFCLTVNAGIVLPFAVNLGTQPNEVVGKPAPDQLLRVTGLRFSS